MQKKAGQFNRFIVFLSLLVILPIFVTNFTLNQLLDDMAGLEISETAEQLNNTSELIAGSIHSEAFLKPIFNTLVRRCLELDEDDLEGVKSLSRETDKEAGVKIDIYLFSSEGKLIKTGSSSPEMADAMQYLWSYINEKEPELPYDTLKPTFQKTFGRDFHPRKVRGQSNKIVSFLANNRPGMLFHSRKKSGENRRRGIILHVKDLPSHDEILKKSMGNLFSKGVRLAILLDQQKQKLIVDQVHEEMVKEVLNKMRAEAQTTLVYQNTVWNKTDISDFSIIAGKESNTNLFFRLKSLVHLLSLLLLAAGSAVTYRHFFSARKIWVSIRIKLIMVFIFAVYLPLLGLFFLSYKGLQDRRTVLENQARKGMLDVLYKIDSDFALKEEEILATFNRVFEDRTWQTKLTDNWFENDRLLRQQAGVEDRGENFFNWLDIRNTRLEQLFCTAKGEANDRIKELNRVMALISLEKFNPGIIAPSAKKVRQSDFIIRNIIENPVLGFSHFFEVPGQLVPMEFEGAFLYWYWNYYEEPIGDVVFFSGNTRVQFNAISYMQKALKRRFSLDNTALKIFSYHPTEQKWLPSNYEDEAGLANFTRLGALNKRITLGRVSYDNSSYLATCFPGTKLKDVYLTCLFPVREINLKIEALRSQIYLGMTLILVIAILTGLLLTRTFLKPAGELNEGLMALRQRNTDFRVAIESKDEFGELGQTFNQMMVEVKEMLLAGAVQQCLIPTDPPEIPGHQLVIFNQMATDVGGDYADAFLLPENRFLLVLGDVTGHGISSSILTAMVKALIFRFSKCPKDLSLIMKELSEMIFDLLKHRKLMTFCAIIVDKDSGEFIMANAGHPYPIISDKDGQIKKVEHSSLPLGVSKKRSNYPTKTGTLTVGDVLVLYTDGIAEAANEKGEIFGFDRVESIISKNCQKSAKELQEILLNEFWQHYTDKALDDDLTFVILKKEA